jgi:uncharacterized protein (DUF58 family)
MQDDRVKDGQVTIRLRARWLWAWTMGLVATAVLLPHPAWNALLVGWGGMLLIGYAWTLALGRGLVASRQLRFGWVAVGDRLSEQFELQNTSAFPALWVEVWDGSNVPGYNAAIVQSVGSGDAIRWRNAAVCLRRGQFHLGPWSISAGDPFGLFRATRRYGVGSAVIIHPPIYTTLPIPLPAGQSSGRARARERTHQATINAAGARDYQPGDPLRWVHWRASAHHDTLMVREFDLDAAGELWLLLDFQATAQLGEGAASSEEQAILLAAALAARALKLNRGTGLAVYGREPQLVPPGLGQGQQWRLLRALALASADGEAGLGVALRDLGNVARKGATAVIITPNGSPDWLPELLALTRRGVQGHVILLDRPSFGGEGGSDGLRDAIRRLGLAAHVVRQGEIGQPLTEQERRGYWDFRVTPHGRVITVRNPLEEGRKHEARMKDGG